MTKKGGGRPGDDILNELTSVSSLLGDAGRDVDPDGLDDSVPVLQPDTPAAGEGDADAQIPLLGADDPDKPAPARDLKKELASRNNPFLPHKQIDELEKSRRQADAASPRAASAPPSAAATAATTSPTSSASDEQIRQAVDAVMAEWMPRLEADLRARLTRLLKS